MLQIAQRSLLWYYRVLIWFYLRTIIVRIRSIVLLQQLIALRSSCVGPSSSSAPVPSSTLALSSAPVSSFSSAPTLGAGSPASGGFSDGAKAGIGVGVPIALAAAGALGFLLFKMGIIGGGAAAAVRSGQGGSGGGSGSPPGPAWPNVTEAESVWNGGTGFNVPASVPQSSAIPPILIAGAIERSNSECNRNSYLASASPISQGTQSSPKNPSAYGPGYPSARSVSPSDTYPLYQEILGSPVHYADEMSVNGSGTTRTELSTSGAYPGHEIYSTEVYEAPSNAAEHQPVLQAYDSRHWRQM